MLAFRGLTQSGMGSGASARLHEVLIVYGPSLEEVPLKYRTYPNQMNSMLLEVTFSCCV
jgi:hypothetical protein